MYKSPSSPSLKKPRSRKGTPCRAPGKSSNKPGAPTGHINTSGALLLLALLREGRKGHPFDNTRHKSPSPFSSSSGGALDGGKRRRERDTLPPPPVGYGRGKRSASATVSNVGDASPSAAGSTDVYEPHQSNGSVSGATATATRKGKGKGDTAASNGKRVGRAESVESSPADHHLTIVTAHAHSAQNSNMSRSSSTGISAHHHAPSTHSHSPLHPHEIEHVPSPLARSFSFGQEHSRSSSGSPMAQVAVRERESRKLDAPHHLQ